MEQRFHNRMYAAGCETKTWLFSSMSVVYAEYEDILYVMALKYHQFLS